MNNISKCDKKFYHKGPSTYDVMVKISFFTNPSPLCHGFAFEISQKFNGASQVANHHPPKTMTSYVDDP
jgi:hypothetical protein